MAVDTPGFSPGTGNIRGNTIGSLKTTSPMLGSIQATSLALHSPPNVDVARKHIMEEQQMQSQLQMRVKNAKTLRLQNSYETASLMLLESTHSGGDGGTGSEAERRTAREMLAMKRMQYPAFRGRKMFTSLPCFDCGKSCKCPDCDVDWLIASLMDVSMVKQTRDVGQYFNPDMLLEDGEQGEEAAAQEQMESMMSKVSEMQEKEKYLRGRNRRLLEEKEKLWDQTIALQEQVHQQQSEINKLNDVIIQKDNVIAKKEEHIALLYEKIEEMREEHRLEIARKNEERLIEITTLNVEHKEAMRLKINELEEKRRAEVAILDDRIETLETELSDLRAEKQESDDAYENQIKSINEALNNKTAEAQSQRKKIRELQEIIDELRSKLDMKTDDVDALKKQQTPRVQATSSPSSPTSPKEDKLSSGEEEKGEKPVEKKKTAVERWGEEGIPDEVLQEIRNEVLSELDDKYGVEVEELYLKLKQAGEQLVVTREGLRKAEVDVVQHEAELGDKRVKVRRLEKQLELEINEHLEAQKIFHDTVRKVKSLEREGEAREKTLARAWGRKGAPKDAMMVQQELEVQKLRNMEMMERMRNMQGRMKTVHKLASRLKSSSVRYLFRKVTDGRDGDFTLPQGRPR